MTANLTGFQRFVPVSLLALPAVLCLLWLAACSVQEPLAQAPSADEQQVQEPLGRTTSQTPAEVNGSMDIKNDEGAAEGTVAVQSRLATRSVETVGSIEFDGTSVNATVVSTGCTTSENFSVEHAQDADTCHVVLLRNKADFCRRAPFVATVSVPWVPPANCESQSVVFDNPIADPEGASARKSTQQK